MWQQKPEPCVIAESPPSSCSTFYQIRRLPVPLGCSSRGVLEGEFGDGELLRRADVPNPRQARTDLRSLVHPFDVASVPRGNRPRYPMSGRVHRNGMPSLLVVGSRAVRADLAGDGPPAMHRCIEISACTGGPTATLMTLFPGRSAPRLAIPLQILRHEVANVDSQLARQGSSPNSIIHS